MVQVKHKCKEESIHLNDLEARCNSLTAHPLKDASYKSSPLQLVTQNSKVVPSEGKSDRSRKPKIEIMTILPQDKML